MRFLSYGFIFILVMGLAGCGSVNLPNENIPDVPLALSVSAAQSEGESLNQIEPYTVFVQQKIKRAQLEPQNGVLLGAYITEDYTIDGSIASFENALGNHALYAIHMTMGQPYPINAVLACVAAGKLPYIVIELPTDIEAFSMTHVDALLDDWLNIPTLVNFYPVTGKKAIKPSSYIRFYTEARAAFRERADRAAFIWEYPEKLELYPGTDSTDWIGVNIAAHSDDTDIYKLLEPLDTAYAVFSREKPILLTLAVSSYSTADNQYRVNEAADRLTRLYGVLENYPRVKAVVYRDVNETLAGGSQNYLLTEDAALTEAYKTATQLRTFMRSMPDTSAQEIYQLIKLNQTAYKRGDTFLLPCDAMRGLVETDTAPREFIRNAAYADAAAVLPPLELDMYEDLNARRLYIFEGKLWK